MIALTCFESEGCQNAFSKSIGKEAVGIRLLAGVGIGLLAGLLSGLVGVGGGILMVPLMVELLKFRQHQAHGTSLVAIVFTGLTGAFAYVLEGSVDIVSAFALALTATFTARVGARFTKVLPEWKLRRSFGTFLLFVAFLLLFKYRIHHFNLATNLWSKVFALLATGLLTGFISGMMGVGGGLIMVPAMVLLVGLSQHTAQGTSLLVMVPTGMVGAWTHWKLGHVVLDVAMGLVAGVLVGTYAGAKFAHSLPEDQLRLIFAVFVTAMSLRYLLSRSTSKKGTRRT